MRVQHITDRCRQQLGHLRVHGLIDSYVDGELTGPGRLAVAAHLAACWACSGYAETLRLVKHSLRASPRRTPPNGKAPRAMMRAIWNGQVLAETPRTKVVEGNHYFPPDSLNPEFFTDSPARTLCPWKGMARYYIVDVDGQVNPDAAWYYPHPFPLARRIKNHVAFWNGVRVEGTREEQQR